MTKRTKTTRPAAIYVRISQDRGGAGLGVERQEQESRALAQRLGWSVVKVYCDDDISAFTGKRRPAYENMLADLEAGKITAVIAWHPDRLHRRIMELERYIGLCEKHHVENQTVTAGIWDLSTPSGRMVARTLGNAAAYESEHKSERLKSARIQQAKNGGHHGGQRCYGYAKDGLTIVPGEAAEIQAAATAIAGGASLRAVVRDMNTRRVPTTTGKVGGWTSQQLRQTLMSPGSPGTARMAASSMRTPGSIRPSSSGRRRGRGSWMMPPGGPSRPSCPTRPGGPMTERPAQSSGWGREPTFAVSAVTANYAPGCPGAPSSAPTGAPTATTTAPGGTSAGRRNRWTGSSRTYSWPGCRGRGPSRNCCTATTAPTSPPCASSRSSWGRVRIRPRPCSSTARSTRCSWKTITRRADGRGKQIAGILAKAGWRSPLEPLADGDIGAAWRQLPMMARRAILDVVADVTVLPTRPTTRGFDPDGVRIEWKVS